MSLEKLSDLATLLVVSPSRYNTTHVTDIPCWWYWCCWPIRLATLV